MLRLAGPCSCLQFIVGRSIQHRHSNVTSTSTPLPSLQQLRLAPFFSSTRIRTGYPRAIHLFFSHTTGTVDLGLECACRSAGSPAILWHLTRLQTLCLPHLFRSARQLRRRHRRIRRHHRRHRCPLCRHRNRRWDTNQTSSCSSPTVGIFLAACSPTRAPSVGSACCPWAKFPILRSSIPLEPLAVLADQDSVLGSMTAMPQARRLLNAEGATAPNFFIHTPVCCPSRASYISGRMFHRLRINGDGGSAPGEGPPPLVPGANGGGCMQDGCMCINTTLVNTDSFPMYLKVGAGTATSAAGICIVCSIWMGNALFYHD